MADAKESPQHPPEQRHAGAIARAIIGLSGVAASVGGGTGGFASLRLLAQDFAVSADGTRAFLTPMAAYHMTWLVFFAGLLAVGISLMAATIQGRSEDIVPGPSIYIMGVTLVIAAMFQLVFGRPSLAAASAVVGIVLMVAEWRSAFL